MRMVRRTRVLHVITTTWLGGAERMLQKLLAELDKQSFESSVVSIRSKGAIGKAIEISSGISVRSLRASGYLSAAVALPELASEIRHFCPDVIQGWMYHGNIAALAGSMLAGSSAPVIWNVRHSLQNLSKEKVLTSVLIRLGAPLSRAACKVVYNSGVGAEQHASIGYSRNNAVLIPNGFDLSSYRPAASEDDRNDRRKTLGIADEVFAVGMIARHDQIKGHADFLAAAAICSRQAPEVRYLMAGTGANGTNSQLLGLIRSYGLEDSVSLLGERNDIAGILPAMDVVVLSSLSEGFPNVLGEAMACGLPCIATDVGDCSRIMGDSGIMVQPRRPDLLARAMIRLQKEPRESRRLRGDRARARVGELYSIEMVARSYESLYRAVATRL